MVSFWGDSNALKLTVVIFSQLYEYTTDLWTVYFKWVNCTAYELYFNKAVT